MNPPPNSEPDSLTDRETLHSEIDSNDWVDLLAISIWAAVCLVLFALTWKLWVLGFTDFPIAPLLLENTSGLQWAQYAASGAIVIALIGVVIRLPRQTILLAVLATGLLVSFICNQHCLQAWAWQTFLFAVPLWGLPRLDAKRWIGNVLISIYIFSAISKFDYQFLHTTGNHFLETLFSLFGSRLPESEKLQLWMTGGFPVGELLIGIGLLFRQTQRLTVFAAIGMHLTLILLLIKLQHHPAVIVWNGLQIMLVIWIFWSYPHDLHKTKADVRKPATSIRKLGTMCFAWIVLLLPLLKPVGVCDHWMAWGLYSPNNSRVRLTFPPPQLELLPEDLQAFCQQSDIAQPCRFRLGQWSLAEVDAPIYPEARVQKAIALELIRRYSDIDWKLTELGPSHPIDGERTETNIEPQR